VSQWRLTHNAVVAYQRRLAPSQSISGAYQELKRACASGRYEQRPPGWLRENRGKADGYVLLEGEVAALPLRNGRAITCLCNPVDGLPLENGKAHPAWRGRARAA
jgi:hypothetical protein